MRAAGTIKRWAGGCVHGFFQDDVFCFQKCQTRFDQIASMEARNPRRNHTGNLRDRKIGLRRQQPIAAWMHPLAFFVELSNHARTYIIAPVVELFFELVFNDLAFFFHHQNLIQATRKFAHAVWLQGPRHGNFV